MDISQIKGIIFDKDGTLFDFATTWETWAASFLTRLSDGDRTLADKMGQAIDFDLNSRSFAPDSLVIAGTPMEVATALQPFCPGMAIPALLDLLNEEAALAPQQPAVPLAPLLGGFRESGVALGVATNDAEVPALAHLSGAGVADYFDFIAGSDSGYGGKPAPGQLLAFAETFGLARDEILMVGDSMHDLLAARNAGMPSVGVLTGYASREQLEPHANAVLPDIGHLPAWLQARN